MRRESLENPRRTRGHNESRCGEGPCSWIKLIGVLFCVACGKGAGFSSNSLKVFTSTKRGKQNKNFTSLLLVTLPSLKSVTTSGLIDGRQAGGFQTLALIFLLLHYSVPQSFLEWLMDWRAVDPLFPEYQGVTVINPHPGLPEGPDGSPAPRAASGPFLIKPPLPGAPLALHSPRV